MSRVENKRTIDIDGNLFLKYINEKDENCFRQLFDSLNPWLFNLILYYTGDRSGTKDILHTGCMIL